MRTDDRLGVGRGRWTVKGTWVRCGSLCRIRLTYSDDMRIHESFDTTLRLSVESLCCQRVDTGFLNGVLVTVKQGPW